jgi:hypothetical protein
LGKAVEEKSQLQHEVSFHRQSENLWDVQGRYDMFLWSVVAWRAQDPWRVLSIHHLSGGIPQLICSYTI